MLKKSINSVLFSLKEIFSLAVIPIVLIAIGGLIIFEKIDKMESLAVGLAFVLVGYLFAIVMTLDKNLKLTQESNDMLISIVKEIAEGSEDYRIEYREK